MRVLLLGANGMLGKAVHDVLSCDCEVIPVSRHEFDVSFCIYDHNYFSNFVKRIGEVDWVVNCIGVTIPHAKRDSALTYFVNSVFPQMLAREYGHRLIHITTDCVYSGTDGGAPYNENSPHSPKDVYGLSKSFGEPADCLTIRTSIIGPDGDGTGLLGWFRQQTGRINGFTNHTWNGITTKQFGKVCLQIMRDGGAQTGVYHVFGTTVTKYQMLLVFREKYSASVQITPTISDTAVNRELSTIRGLNAWLRIPTFEEMIQEM